MEVPYATPPRTPIEPHEGRFSSTVKPISEYTPDPDGRRAVAILGMPDDTGVKMNNGRAGANEGPGAIRRALTRMGVDKPATFVWPTVYDAGDVLPVGDDLDETHRRVSKASAALTSTDLFPIGLGGGHDLTFAFVRGVLYSLPQDSAPHSGAYLDAHLDVRETKGSGMPFRKLIEECGVERLTINAFDAAANTREHFDWFESHGGEIGSPTDFELGAKYTFASLDLDAIDAAHAPGVSAPNPTGCSAFDASWWANHAMQFGDIKCFDIMELSPPHDEDERTARIAARILLNALEGLACRYPAQRP